MDDEKFWDELEKHQYDLILEKYGERAAVTANYGWGVEETEKWIRYSTKIYYPERVVMDTLVNAEGNPEYQDSWYIGGDPRP